MENLLIMGIDTRPMVNSALRLDYRTFSISYFKTADFKIPFKEKHILDQESVNSCGNFEDNYSPQKLLELSRDILYKTDANTTIDEKINKNKKDETKNSNLNKKPSIENSEIDKIVLTTGINANDFMGEFSKFKNKIVGNKKTETVDDKFKFYKKLKNKFNVPSTFQPKHLSDLIEILKQNDNLSFILKPVKGSGGLGFLFLNNERLHQLNNIEKFFEKIDLENYMLQEYVSGINLSSSVLGSKNDARNIFNSRLITENDLGKDSFEYSGNIMPLDFRSINKFNHNNIQNNSIETKGQNNNSIQNNIQKYNFSQNNNQKNNFSQNNNQKNDLLQNKKNSNLKNKFSEREVKEINEEMKILSEDLIRKFNLVGSNGIDFILGENGLNVIEINPRFQGTYELCENVMDINLLEAHIKACEGELIEIPPIERYGIKKIVYSKKQILIGDLNLKNVYDIPYNGVKIEANQPIITIISSDKDLEIAIRNMEIAEKQMYEHIS
ncbi:ATP-grasp domain-containing protein [uncultured Methanobrevibacter sp.]|uniref:ATP-grasp domain-containing protein n=1 Tax=uncultured Methanobrevibacter sp. TaxID=253161 RepID=UPI002603DC1D